jgi:hypothetical protein
MATKKKLSQRPLKRWTQFTVELGVYGNGTAQKFVLWTSFLPRGKHARFIAVVQQVNRPGNLGDRAHNPHVFQKIARLTDTQEDEYKAKYVYYQAKKAMYFLLKQELEQASRPKVRIGGAGEELATFEPGFATDTLGRWREATLQKIATTTEASALRRIARPILKRESLAGSFHRASWYPARGQ